MTISKKKYILLPFTALLICSAVIFYVRHHRAWQRDHEDKIFLNAVPFQTAYGWGYDIMADNKIHIHQEFIPGITGKQGFRSREDALLVGRKVIQKIINNQMPTISEKDLEELGILKK
jgi:hypothetical protein